MSRALRRQPLVQKPPAKSPSFRPSGPKPAKKPQESAAATPAEATRKRSFYERFVPRYVKDVISELRKVTWPTREETTRLTFAVIVVSLAIGLMLGGVDLAFEWIIEKTILR